MTTNNKAAGTALGPMVVAATEQFLPKEQRIVDDSLAAGMLSGTGRLFVDMCRWTPLRQMLFRLSEKRGPGVWGGILCRKRHIDDITAAALAEGIEALVVLGAGFDTRGIRLAAPAGIPAFEIDLPENIAVKQTTLEKAFGRVSDKVHLVPVDFETVDLDDALAAAGYDPGYRTLFVMEGVTQYLTGPTVQKTFDFLARAVPGSKLVFTYVLEDFIAGENMYDAAAVHRHLVETNRLWHFGLAPDKLEAFLDRYGWCLVEDVGAKDHCQRYLEPAGRDLPVMEIERIAFAEKTR